MKAPYRLALLALSMAVAQPALSKDGDKIFDVHVHLHKGEASLAEYEKQVADAKLNVAGIGAMWFGGPNQVPAGKIAETRAGNDALIALAARHKGVLPIATVHPYDGKAAIAELERVAAKGVRVLKIHAHTQKFDNADPRVLTLVKRAGELGVVVLMDNANILPGDSEKLFNLALAAPKTNFIFAHIGAMNFRFWNILGAARTADGLFANNIYFDISATAAMVADSPMKEEFVWTLRNVGTDYLIMGSDFPQYTLPQMMTALDKLELTDAEREKILYGNAQKLLKLPD